MGYLLGRNAKAYALTSGTRATWGAATDGIHSGAAPSNLTEIDQVKGDLKATLAGTEADITVRASNGYKLTAKAMKDVTVDFDLMYDSTNTIYQFLLKAWLNDTVIGVAVLDGDKATVGTQGFWADWVIVKFDKNEPIGDAQTVSVSLKPTLSAVPPEWVTVASGS